MLRFLSRWIIPGIFGDSYFFTKKEFLPVASELRILVNRTFGRHIKNLKIEPETIEPVDKGLFAYGSVAKLFATSKKDEEESKDIQIEIYHYPEDNSIRVNLVDTSTGEIRQKPYKYLRGG